MRCFISAYSDGRLIKGISMVRLIRILHLLLYVAQTCFFVYVASFLDLRGGVGVIILFGVYFIIYLWVVGKTAIIVRGIIRYYRNRLRSDKL